MQFNYLVKTRAGETLNGVVEAANQKSAVEALQAKNYIVLGIQNASSTPFFLQNMKFLQRVKSKDLVSFVRQLATLASAQVTLLTSLRSLAKQTENVYFQEVIYEVANDVESGTIFSKALAKHPKVFSSFFINMVKSGEVSGSLEASLNYLADYIEKQFYLAGRVRNAMAYPAFVTGAFILIAILMLIFVIPKLTGFLAETGQALPLPTRVIIGVSSFMQSWWWLFFLAIVGGGFYVSYAWRSRPEFQEWTDRLLLNIPLFGKKVFQKFYLARITENLSTLIQGGLTILQAIQVTADVADNRVYKKIMMQAQDEVRVGNSFSSALAKHKEIPPIMVQMVETGEQTGSLDDILKKMGQFYTREVDSTVDGLSQLIEPILVLLIGAGIVVLMVAILLPIYNLANGI